MFEDFDFNKSTNDSSNGNNNSNSWNNKGNKGNYNNKYKNNNYNNKKKSYPNIKGGYKIDIWNGKDLSIKTTPFNTNNASDKKIVTFVNRVKGVDIDAEDKKEILEIMKKLAADGYKLRIICDYAQPLTSELIGIFEDKNVYLITPWKSYCKLNNKDMSMYMPTDNNIELAAYYFKNYQKLPGAIKAINAAVATTLVGMYNNEPATFVLAYDKFYSGKDIDFRNSKDASNFYILAKKIGISVFNLAREEEKERLGKII